jgi:hypothetical protein
MNTSSLSSHQYEILDSSFVLSSSSEHQQPPMERWLFSFTIETADREENENHPNPMTVPPPTTQTVSSMGSTKDGDTRGIHSCPLVTSMNRRSSKIERLEVISREKKIPATDLTKLDFNNLSKIMFRPTKCFLKKRDLYEKISSIHE